MIDFEKLKEFGFMYSELKSFLELNFNKWLDLVNRKYYLENNDDEYFLYREGYGTYFPDSNDYLRIDNIGYNQKGFLTIYLTFFKESCYCDFCKDTNYPGIHSIEIPSTFFTNNQGLISNMEKDIEKLVEQIREKEKIEKQKKEAQKIEKQKKQEEKEFQNYLKLHEKYKNKIGEIL